MTYPGSMVGGKVVFVLPPWSLENAICNPIIAHLISRHNLEERHGSKDSLRTNEAACLTIHSLRTQGRRNKIDHSVCWQLVPDGGLCAGRPLKSLQLDAHVLLDRHTFTSAAVMVQAGLAVLGTVWVSQTKLGKNLGDAALTYTQYTACQT